MYSKLALFFCLLLMTACHKSDSGFDQIIQRETALIASSSDAFDKVKDYLAQQFPDEQLLAISQVSFIHAKSKLIALVFYQSSTGEHNLVIEQTVGADQQLMGEKISFCQGDDCTCKITAVIDNMGNVDLGCNCSSCIMITTEV